MGGERLQCWLQPLCITQQWCLASVAVWVSSTSIPGCRFSPSHPLRLSPCSQQQSSLRVCSPNPTFQLSAPVCTGTHVLVWGVQGCGMDHLCRSHSVLSATDQLFHPPLTASNVPLLSQVISPSSVPAYNQIFRGNWNKLSDQDSPRLGRCSDFP